MADISIDCGNIRNAFAAAAVIVLKVFVAKYVLYRVTSSTAVEWYIAN